MKLFTRYNRINISVTILIFLLGSVAFYFVLQYVLLRQLDDTLKSEQQEVVEYIRQHHQLPEIQNTKHQWMQIIKSAAVSTKTSIQTIPFYNQEEKELEYIRQLIFFVKIGADNYQITVNKSETETEDLLQLIILVTVGLIGLILLCNYLINRRLVSQLWKPFYTTIDRIRDYAAIQQPLQLSKEPIDEINLLNDSLNSMTQRIHDDFFALRSFTENASHEMQTPLAIIRLKVEALMQETEGNEGMLQKLLSIEDASTKLSKLYQSLLLLTKLENRQFVLNEQVNIKEILKNKLTERKELIEAKQLRVQFEEADLQIPFHHHLAEILINNLLNNAIKYTPANGEIEVILLNNALTIANSSAHGSLDSTKVFQRFYKLDADHSGTGLGLAIIHEICTMAGFKAQYNFNQNKQVFTINFK